MNFDSNKDGDSLEIIIDKLFSLHRFGIEPGLERIHYLLGKSGNPQNKYKAIHVAGTNGKGTVSSLIASILMSAGYKTGLYTSPHLVRFNERIRINGQSISDADLANLAERYMEIGKVNNSTFFEITTAIAFDYFAENKIDIAVIETGMGGRFDATNVINPVLSVITQIDLDHQDYLGDTLDAIAYEKAGIIKTEVPAVIYEQRSELRSVFDEYANTLNSSITYINTDSNFEIISKNINLTTSLNIKTNELKLTNVELPLPGKHQLGNLLTALESVSQLRKSFSISDEAIHSGIKNVIENTRLIGRIQKISDKPLIILDTAHNPAGIKALINTLDDHGLSGITFIFAAMKDKNIQEMIRIIIESGICDEIIFTTPGIDRAAGKSFFENFISDNKYTMKLSYLNNIKEAFEYASQNSRPVVIAGSFYLAGEFLTYFKQYYQD